MKLHLIGRYVTNVLMSLDQLGNSILLGDPDETISSRLGRIKQKWGGRIPFTRPICKLTDYILDKIDKNHSIDAIEIGEGEAGLIDKPSKEKQECRIIKQGNEVQGKEVNPAP